MPTPLVAFDSVTFEDYRDIFNDMADRLAELTRQEAYVGSAVVYARHVHDGTRFVGARPFMLIGALQVPATIGQGRDVLGGANIYSDPDRLWNYLTGGLAGQPRTSLGRFAQRLTPEQLMGEIGEVWRIEAQRAIVALGAVDTANLLMSIAWGRTEDEMLNKSRAAALDKSTLV